MVLAETKNLYILHDYHLIMSLVKDSAVNDIPNVLLIALGEIQHCLCVAVRGTQDTFPIRVFTNAL